MKEDLKFFFTKLVAIVIAIIIIINVTYNLILADKLETLNYFFSFKENKNEIKNKIRKEIYNALEKDRILNKEDKILLKKIYIKLKKEFEKDE